WPGEVWRGDPAGGAPGGGLAGFSVPPPGQVHPPGAVAVPHARRGRVGPPPLPAGARPTPAPPRARPRHPPFDRPAPPVVAWCADGAIAEIQTDGSERELVRPGFCWPAELACDGRGTVYAADGLSVARLVPGERPRRLGVVVQAGFPGNVRGLASAADGTLW